MSRQGTCPRCGSGGAAGEPCSTKTCKRSAVHLVPQVHGGVAPERTDDAIGLVFGDYLVVRPIGYGNFGSVYTAFQMPLREPPVRVAVKLMSRLEPDPKEAARLLTLFESEIRALSMLSHPNVVRIFRADSSHDPPYLVMEFIDGAKPLDQLIHDDRIGEALISWDHKRAILDQILNGLEAAHDADIVHRDIKPDNILLQVVAGHPHLVRIVDFGLAEFVGEQVSPDAVMGTPWYMAPEQFERRQVGPWTDVYAVGVLAMELLVGYRPFEKMGLGDIIRAKSRAPSFSPEALKRLGCSTRSIAFFEQAVHPNPRHRFADVRAFRGALEQVIDELRMGPTLMLDKFELRRLEGDTPNQSPTTMLPDELELSRRLSDTMMLDPPPRAPAPTPRRSAEPERRPPPEPSAASTLGIFAIAGAVVTVFALIAFFLAR